MDRRVKGKKMLDLRNVSFGGTAALVTCTGLVVGLDTAAVPKTVIIGSLLIAGCADNLTDALSVHAYQEAEGLPQPAIWRTTIANFLARFAVSVSFIALVAITPRGLIEIAAIVWGLSLLAALTFKLAQARRTAPLPEILKHGAVAIVVIILSRAIGGWIASVAGFA